jgi:hypothetical protein
MNRELFVTMPETFFQASNDPTLLELLIEGFDKMMKI